MHAATDGEARAGERGNTRPGWRTHQDRPRAPEPSRLASIALGTGDIDCVYHFALHELQATLKAQERHEAEDLLAIMVNGKRLRDISDLPLDLAV